MRQLFITRKKPTNATNHVRLHLFSISDFLILFSPDKVHVNLVIVLLAATQNGPWFSQSLITTYNPVWFQFFQFICNSTSTMRVACMDTMNLCGEAMYKGFYYISLIKAGLYSSLGYLSFILTCKIHVYEQSLRKKMVLLSVTRMCSKLEWIEIILPFWVWEPVCARKREKAFEKLNKIKTKTTQRFSCKIWSLFV